jgi:HK97 family phage prohead protease
MNGSPIELRSDGGTLTLEGYASTFGVWYPIAPNVKEKMVRRSFADTLARSPAVALRIEHGQLPLAYTKSGTLQLSETAEGLLTVATLNERDPDVQSLRAKSENSPLDMSFAFRADRERWNEDRTRREVLAADIDGGDVSVVCYGANPQTSMSINAREACRTLEERRAFAERIRGFVVGPQAVALEKPRGRSQIRVHSYIEVAKARRAQLRTGLRAHPGSGKG